MSLRWITPAGNLGTIQERRPFELELEVETDQEQVTFSLLSGNLPRGLRIEGGKIIGFPNEVRIFTTSRFVIRANDGKQVKDRTFEISVDGADIPQWITKEGFLQVGRGETFFVLDNSRVEFQLEAFDPDVIAGDVLEFYLVPQGGELPPGLTLSRDGLISGFTDPIFSVEYDVNRRGGYDVNPYDITPIDFQRRDTNGFDTFLYDLFGYDYNEPSLLPRRLSRIYNFVVAVTDGLHTVNRLFKIYVVTEDFLRADNSIVQVGTGIFTADNDATRMPIWITEPDLGKFRANNHVTIFLEIYNPPSLPGSISYILTPDNPDGSASQLPPGMRLDSTNGLISGVVPYQSKITVTYQFTVLGIFFPEQALVQPTRFRQGWQSSEFYAIGDTVRFQNFIYICRVANIGELPTNTEFWDLTVSTSERTFLVDVFGEIDSGVRWLTNSNLGTIKPNRPSLLSVEAESLLDQELNPGIFDISNFRFFTKEKNIAGFYDFINEQLRQPVGTISPNSTRRNRIFYQIISGRLPPGLTFLNTGIIQGKVKQFADDAGLGLTRFASTTFDQGTTTFDRKFEFTIRARDGFRFAERDRAFSVTVLDDSDLTFANLWVKAFQTKQKRLDWYSFITDSEIFVPDFLYRIGDENFGVQTEVKMLLYAGIESREAVKYVQAMSRNHYRKRLLFGDVKIAKARDPDTQETIYEVVYVDVVDDLENSNGTSISNEIRLPRNTNSPVLVSYDAINISSDIPLASDRDHQRVFPNSIKNMRSRINDLGEREREFLPLWMRSIQDEGSFETGFVRALVLCYANPTHGDEIVSRIRASGFDFKTIDFEIDRYVIDVLEGQFEDKYLAFPQRGEKLP